MLNDRADIDYVLDKLGVKTPRSRDMLVPGIRGYLHEWDSPFPKRAAHIKEETVEEFSHRIADARARGTKIE